MQGTDVRLLIGAGMTGAGPDLHRHSGGRAGQARRGPSARGRHL